MDPLYRISLKLWLLLSHLPPVSPGRLLMPAIFASAWTILTLSGLAQETSFVWSAVLAQAAQFWAVLPGTIGKQRQRGALSTFSVIVMAVIVIAALALQVWIGAPWFSQRLVSAYAAFYILCVLLALRGDRELMDHFAPVPTHSVVPTSFRIHLLRLYALVATLTVAINESLLILEIALGARVTVLSLLPIVLHYFFAMALHLTSPWPDEPDD